MRPTIHFEGLPGAGKTTASKRFCQLLQQHGIDASWWLEEAADHPFTRQHSREPIDRQNTAQHYLHAWQNFLGSSDNTAVLDGYALQSTVRFLYANQIARVLIERYFDQWQAYAPDAILVYLATPDPLEHFDIVLAERGDAWTKKLCQYVERTPLGVANGYRGRAGLVTFWAEYQRLCVDLLNTADLSVHQLDSRSWADNNLKLLATETGLIPDSG